MGNIPEASVLAVIIGPAVTIIRGRNGGAGRGETRKLTIYN
jgi:hypothetical protein